MTATSSPSQKGRMVHHHHTPLWWAGSATTTGIFPALPRSVSFPGISQIAVMQSSMSESEAPGDFYRQSKTPKYPSESRGYIMGDWLWEMDNNLLCLSFDDFEAMWPYTLAEITYHWINVTQGSIECSDADAQCQGGMAPLSMIQSTI